MTTPLHSAQQPADGIHTPIAFTYASSASLAAATGFIATDLYKMALVASSSVWVLDVVSPPNWVQVGNATSSSIYANVSASYIVAAVDAQNPNERKLVGSGGTSVSDGGAGGNFTISSSFYANQSASYLVAALDAQNPNERRIAGLAGTTVIDNGAGSTLQVSSSIDADVSASYLLVGANARDVNFRKLTAGSGITFVDGGAGGNFTIGAGGGAFVAPFLTASYTANSLGHLQWKGANYSLTNTDDFVGVSTMTANLTMSLPPASGSGIPGKIFYIADMAGSASINPFLIKPFGNDTIDLTTGSIIWQANFGTARLLSLYDGWKSV